MNKFTVSLLTLLMAATVIQSAKSATTAQLNIQGVIEPAACDITIAQQADFRNIKRDVLKTRAGGSLLDLPSAATAKFKVKCDGKASTYISVNSPLAAAAFSSLASSPQQIGALKSNSKDIGAFTLQLTDIKLDGKKVTPLTSSASSWKSLTATEALNLNNVQRISGGSASAPTAAKEMEGTLTVKAVLDENLLTQNGDETKFSGTAVLTVSYI